MLECPNCGEILTPIHLSTDGGGHITVDHCGSCGGTWFDNYEINRVSYEDVFKIAANTAIKKREPSPGKMERLCPQDSSKLEKLKTNLTEENLYLERCPACGGVFVGQKDLEKIKLAQKTKIHYYQNSGLPFPQLSAIFIPIVFVGLLLFSTFLTVTNLRDAQQSQTSAKEQLSAVTAIPVSETSEAVMYLTASSTVTSIQYGTNIFNKKVAAVDISPSRTHQIVLKGLTPGTTYYYVISLTLPSGQAVASPEYSFTTVK